MDAWVTRLRLPSLNVSREFLETFRNLSVEIYWLFDSLQGFFDKLGAGEITTRITADTNLVQDGMSEKVGLTINAVSTFITAFVIG